MTGRLQYSHNPYFRQWLQQRFGLHDGIHWKAESSMFSCKNGVRNERGLAVLVLILLQGGDKKSLSQYIVEMRMK